MHTENKNYALKDKLAYYILKRIHNYSYSQITDIWGVPHGTIATFVRNIDGYIAEHTLIPLILKNKLLTVDKISDIILYEEDEINSGLLELDVTESNALITEICNARVDEFLTQAKSAKPKPAAEPVNTNPEINFSEQTFDPRVREQPEPEPTTELETVAANEVDPLHALATELAQDTYEFMRKQAGDFKIPLSALGDPTEAIPLTEVMERVAGIEAELMKKAVRMLQDS